MDVMLKMSSAMKILLKLKAWQMFVLILLPMLAPGYVLNKTDSFNIFLVVMIIWLLVIVSWMYTVGATANSLLPSHLKKNITIYRLGFIAPLLYTIFMFLYVMPNLQINPDTKGFPLPTWVIPLHLISVFGMFYGLWFTAKQFVTLQKLKEVKFIDYSGPFFLFWFSPLGVWFLQPKINELFNSKKA